MKDVQYNSRSAYHKEGRHFLQFPEVSMVSSFGVKTTHSTEQNSNWANKKVRIRDIYYF